VPDSMGAAVRLGCEGGEEGRHEFHAVIPVKTKLTHKKKNEKRKGGTSSTQSYLSNAHTHTKVTHRKKVTHAKKMASAQTNKVSAKTFCAKKKISIFAL